jgi:hypothetical protein
MRGEVGQRRSLPLLPAGICLFSDLPARAIVLDALGPPIGDGIITMSDTTRRGVLVVRGGAIVDGVATEGDERTTGGTALAVLCGWETASVSCSRLTGEAMSLLGPLLHGETLYSDLRLEWVAWAKLLDDLRTRGRTCVVEIETPTERGITVIRDGAQVATYSESHPALGDDALVEVLAAGGAGCVRVLVEPVGTRSQGPWMDEPPVVAASVDAVQETTAVHEFPRSTEVPGHPEATVTLGLSRATFVRGQSAALLLDRNPRRVSPARSDESESTFSELFGPTSDQQPWAPVIVPDSSRPTSDQSIEPFRADLKRLVRSRLQRSSEPVENAVDMAADGHQTIEWLSDQVRVMRVRGFTATTFERLAGEMLALPHTV